MQMYKCGECGIEFVISRDVEADEVKCPINRCQGEDLVEFGELDDEEEEDDED